MHLRTLRTFQTLLFEKQSRIGALNRIIDSRINRSRSPGAKRRLLVSSIKPSRGTFAPRAAQPKLAYS